jgi:hypothetical protein
LIADLRLLLSAGESCEKKNGDGELRHAFCLACE